jgi:hypothetical protein
MTSLLTMHASVNGSDKKSVEELIRVMPVLDGEDRWRGGPGGPATPPAAAPARPSAQPQRSRGSSAAKR